MRFDLNTDNKTAVLADGDFTVTSVPPGPTGKDGAVNAHFDAFMTDLQPVLDKHMPVDRGGAQPAAKVQAAPRTDAMRQSDLLAAKIEALRAELAALAAQQASHDARMADAAIVAEAELASLAAKMGVREAKIAQLRAQRDAIAVESVADGSPAAAVIK